MGSVEPLRARHSTEDASTNSTSPDEGVPPRHHRKKKFEIAQAAARGEGQQIQAAVAETGARSKFAQNAAKRTHPHRQQLRNLGDARAPFPLAVKAA